MLGCRLDRPLPRGADDAAAADKCRYQPVRLCQKGYRDGMRGRDVGEGVARYGPDGAAVNVYVANIPALVWGHRKHLAAAVNEGWGTWVDRAAADHPDGDGGICAQPKRSGDRMIGRDIDEGVTIQDSQGVSVNRHRRKALTGLGCHDKTITAAAQDILRTRR